MNVPSALQHGARLVRGSLRFVALAYVMCLAVTLPLAAVVASSLHPALGRGAGAETMRQGYDHLWYQGFSAGARGLASTFSPAIVGAGAVLEALDALVTGALLDQHLAIVLAGFAYLAGWVFLSAGLVARFVGHREHGFFGEAARYLPRFAILAAIAGALYVLVFAFVLAGLDKLVDEATRETIDERVHFLWTVGKYGVVWAMAWCIAMVFDYAKILSVLEPTSLRAAVVGSARLVFGRWRQTFGLSLALTGITAVLMMLYWLVAPGVAQASWLTIGLTFVVGQLYLIARIGVRCLSYAAHTTMCESLTSGS